MAKSLFKRTGTGTGTGTPLSIDRKTLGSILGRVFYLLMFLWFLFVFIPDIFYGMFDTFLGNAILLCIIILVSLRNIVFALCLAIIFFLLFRLAHTGVLGLKRDIPVTEKEGFGFGIGPNFGPGGTEGFSLMETFIPNYKKEKNNFPKEGMSKATHQVIEKLINKN